MENFPPKPLATEPPPPPYQTLISLGLFMLVFYLVFDLDLRLLLVFMGVMIIHEMGHFMVLQHFNYQDAKMFFLPMVGTMLKGPKGPSSQKEKVIVIFAGPIPGIVFGVGIFLAAQYFNAPDLELPAALFLLLNLFNLLPFAPLDGGRLIETLFHNRNYYIQGFFLVLSSSVLILIAILQENVILLIVPLFLMLSLSARSRIRKIRKALDSRHMDYRKSYEELDNKEYWLIREEVLNHIPVIIENDPGSYRPHEQEDRIVKQVKTILNKAPVQDLNLWDKVQVILIWLLALIGPIILLDFFQEGELWKI